MRVLLGSLKFSAVREGGVEFGVVASPGSRVSAVTGMMGGDLKVRVKSAPERGAANREIEEVIAAFLGVGKSMVRIQRGAISRRKRVRIHLDQKAFESIAAARAVPGSPA